ncbi:hypothetical protein GCM10009562_02230 [Nocardioides aquaticus]
MFCAAARWPTSAPEAQSVADVGAGGPVATEVASLDHQVGGHHDVPGAHPQDRRVVPRTHQDVLALGEERGELGDESELPDVGERGVSGEGHDPHPTRGRCAVG